jgi:hypothetical protein
LAALAQTRESGLPIDFVDGDHDTALSACCSLVFPRDAAACDPNPS